MAKNDFKAFATSSDANVISQDDYEALAARSTGFQSGVAKSAQLNKVWRQSSIMSAVLAQFIVDRAGQDALDDGSIDTLSVNLKAAIFNDTELTGTPIAPTPGDNDNSMRVATTAFVRAMSEDYATQKWVQSYAVQKLIDENGALTLPGRPQWGATPWDTDNFDPNTKVAIDSFGSLLAENGYQKIPSQNHSIGLILQWGVGTAPASGTSVASLSVAFPLAFPNKLLSLTGNANDAADLNTGGFPTWSAQNPNKAGFTAILDTLNYTSFNRGVPFFWCAVGY